MALSKKWIDTVHQGISDVKWHEYDNIIKKEVSSYKSRFSRTSIPSVNWLYIKAMLWTESGGPTNRAWKTRPMQIGNPGDPGITTLKKGAEGSDIIMSKELFQAIKAGRYNMPGINIKAGIAYLYSRMAKTEIKSVKDKNDKKLYNYTVAGGDSLEKIAKSNGTTVEELKSQNPTAVKMIKPGQQLIYHRAKRERFIKSWRPFTATNIAKRYNAGDHNYAEKLGYLIKTVFPKIKRK